MHGKEAGDHPGDESDDAYERFLHDIEESLQAQDAAEAAEHAPVEDAPPTDSDYFVEWDEGQPSWEQLWNSNQSLRRALGELKFADEEAREATKQKTERLKAKVAALVTTTELRKWGATKAYSLATGSMSFWVVIIGFQAAMKTAAGVAPLDNNVLIAITTGCTVNVLAAFLGVIRGLFPHKPDPSRRKRKSPKAR
ncbi:hypothetical protein P3W23_09105 [Luteibacter sp. PPL554]